ncbi:sodium-dependent organic anion transporter-like isoform X2 [Brachyhypopomus gauderio]|uniref:sodium-dependent organic anion transporter-like isoform X2 n=1 Tax=Brachyhypopomus gauderio TaxID=698409 RepID=UPI004043059E
MAPSDVVTMWINGSSNVSSAEQNGTLPGDEAVKQALSKAMGATLVLVVFCMGCSVEVRKAWDHLRHPRGVLVGLLCQFGVMPLTSYLLALGLKLTPMQAVAVVILGSCPGGIISNIITYWLDGDMNLSITMTSISTLLGFGALPLCLYIYTRSWVQSGRIQIPYLNIAITFISLIIPVAFGVAVNYKWPNVARIIVKVGSLVGGLLIMSLSITSVLLWNVKWNLSSSLFLVGGIFPMMGFVAGFIIAAALRQPWNRCRTIAMETGAQNMNIFSTLLHLFFSVEQLAEVIILPITYGYVQLFGGVLMVIVFQMYKKLSGKKHSITPRKKQRFPRAQHPQGEINTVFRHDSTCEPEGGHRANDTS